MKWPIKSFHKIYYVTFLATWGQSMDTNCKHLHYIKADRNTCLTHILSLFAHFSLLAT